LHNSDLLKQKEKPLTRQVLLNLLTYSEDTGYFTRKIKVGKLNIGDRAGYLVASGYRYIIVNKIRYAEHRLVWFYCFNSWPKGVIDHKDQNKSNNALINLRDITQKVNCRDNKPNTIKQTTKIKHKLTGVHPSGKVFKTTWACYAGNDYIGIYKSQKEAKQARKNYIENKNLKRLSKFITPAGLAKLNK